MFLLSYLVVNFAAVIHIGPSDSGHPGVLSRHQNGPHHLVSLGHLLWYDPTSQLAVVILGGDIDVEVGAVESLDVFGRQPEGSVGPALFKGRRQIFDDLKKSAGFPTIVHLGKQAEGGEKSSVKKPSSEHLMIIIRGTRVYVVYIRT